MFNNYFIFYVNKCNEFGICSYLVVKCMDIYVSIFKQSTVFSM